MSLCSCKLCFPTNLHSFVSFAKTHKLPNAIDHWLARVTGQAHVALDTITMEGGELFYTSYLPVLCSIGGGGTRRGKLRFGAFKGRAERPLTGGWTPCGCA